MVLILISIDSTNLIWHMNKPEAVRIAKSTTKKDLKNVVEDFARTVSLELIFSVDNNFLNTEKSFAYKS